MKKNGHTNTHHKIILRSKTLEVNSFHDYSITRIGNQFEVLATAEDETIEALSIKNIDYWHYLAS